MLSTDKLRSMAEAIRRDWMDAPMAAPPCSADLAPGLSTLLTALFVQAFHFDPKHPHWPNRDRLVCALGSTGGMLRTLRTVTGHAETEAGSLPPPIDPVGEAVGLAFAERRLSAEFGSRLVDHHTFLLAGPETLASPTAREALDWAGRRRLHKLVVLQMSAADVTSDQGPIGWTTEAGELSDPLRLAETIERAKRHDRPTLIVCKAALSGPDEAAERGDLEQALDRWRLVGLRSANRRREWDEAVQSLEPETRGEFERRMRGAVPSELTRLLREKREKLSRLQTEASTRDVLHRLLDATWPLLPELIAFPLDEPSKAEPIPAEPAAAIVSGVAAHGGLLPLVRWDAFPAGRLAGGRRMVIVEAEGSHVTGIDGCTTLRPADALETVECWDLALLGTDTTVIRPSDEATPVLGPRERGEQGCAMGAYVLGPRAEPFSATLFAAGALVSRALEARRRLRPQGVVVRVVSVPSPELFARQDAAYRDEILGAQAPRIVLVDGPGETLSNFAGSPGDVLVRSEARDVVDHVLRALDQAAA